MCHGLAEARGDAVQDNIDEVIVRNDYLGLDIVSIDIIRVFLDSTSWFEITFLVKSPVQLIIAAIVFSDGGRNLSLSIASILVGNAPFQRISFCT